MSGLATDPEVRGRGFTAGRKRSPTALFAATGSALGKTCNGSGGPVRTASGSRPPRSSTHPKLHQAGARLRGASARCGRVRVGAAGRRRESLPSSGRTRPRCLTHWARVCAAARGRPASVAEGTGLSVVRARDFAGTGSPDGDLTKPNIRARGILLAGRTVGDSARCSGPWSRGVHDGKPIPAGEDFVAGRGRGGHRKADDEGVTRPGRFLMKWSGYVANGDRPERTAAWWDLHRETLLDGATRGVAFNERERAFLERALSQDPRDAAAALTGVLPLVDCPRRIVAVGSGKDLRFRDADGRQITRGTQLAGWVPKDSAASEREACRGADQSSAPQDPSGSTEGGWDLTSACPDPPAALPLPLTPITPKSSTAAARSTGNSRSARHGMSGSAHAGGGEAAGPFSRRGRAATSRVVPAPARASGTCLR